MNDAAIKRTRIVRPATTPNATAVPYATSIGHGPRRIRRSTPLVWRQRRSSIHTVSPTAAMYASSRQPSLASDTKS